MERSGAIFVAVLMRPWLWVTAIVQVFRLAPRRWWMHPPFLPLPSRPYFEFRMVTQYGGSGRIDDEFSVADVVDYLTWCREWNRSGR